MSLDKVKEHVTSNGMTHEYDLGTVAKTIAMRLYVIVKHLLLDFDLLLESERVCGRIRFLAIVTNFEASVRMATNVECGRICRRGKGERIMQFGQKWFVVVNQARVSRHEVN